MWGREARYVDKRSVLLIEEEEAGVERKGKGHVRPDLEGKWGERGVDFTGMKGNG